MLTKFTSTRGVATGQLKIMWTSTMIRSISVNTCVRTTAIVYQAFISVYNYIITILYKNYCTRILFQYLKVTVSQNSCSSSWIIVNIIIIIIMNHIMHLLYQIKPYYNLIQYMHGEVYNNYYIIKNCLIMSNIFNYST